MGVPLRLRERGRAQRLAASEQGHDLVRVCHARRASGVQGEGERCYAAGEDMHEPMTSFAEWKCSECGRLELAETVWNRKARVPRWPVGWRVVTSETFARVVCPRCVDAKAEAR